MSSLSGISSISSAASRFLHGAATRTNPNQTVKDFQALGSALQSGNITGAQIAGAALQKDFPANPQAASSPPFGTNVQANSDYQSLTNALKSGDLTGAQKAFTLLQTDLRSVPADGSTATEATGSSFGNTLNNLLSGVGITLH